jgi:tetratricopeptide (TPR) repeat protein
LKASPLRAAAALAAAVAFAAGCAPVYGDAYLAAFAGAERAFHAGRYAEAAAGWDDAAGRAIRLKDRDEARFLEARAQARAGLFAEERRTYERLVADSPSGPRTVRARFELAEHDIQHGDAARGWEALERVARTYPAHGLSRPTLRRLLQHAEDQGGDAAALTWLETRGAAFRGTDLDEVITYERARALERLERKQEAHDTFLVTAREHPYPSGGLTDDAYWHASMIDEQLGRYAEAVAHLRELLSSREPSGAWASYERPRYSEAQLKIALIYRDDLRDRAAARREFEKLYALHPNTIKRDDAVWAEARLALEDGDKDAACKLARRLLDEFPESRYARCASEVCPSARAPAGQRACADYILRELRGTATDAAAP